MGGSVLHKNHNPPHSIFKVIALCYVSYLNFVWNIYFSAYKIYQHETL